MQVTPKHPDFKGKVGGGLSLWLNDAPDWVLQKLNELEFDVFLPKGRLKHLKGKFPFWKLVVRCVAFCYDLVFLKRSVLQCR